MNNNKKVKILILCDYYEPGFRAGGPITTLTNMVSRLSSIFDFYIISRDRDLLSNEPYKIELNQWIKYSDSHRYYISPNKLSFKLMKKLIQELSPRVVYLNSFFSYRFSVIIVLLKKLKLINNSIILCPRGEFKNSALSKGKLKKIIYINLSKILSFYSAVLWQATNETEELYIRKIFSSKIKSVIASNITRPITTINELVYNTKNKNNLKLVYVGRIHRIKNLLYNLEILPDIKGIVNFDIIGSVQDHEYWKACKKKIEAMPENINMNEHRDMPNNEVIMKLKN